MALKIKNNPVQFGGHLGGRTLLIVLLVVSLILFVAYARESEEGPIHTLQNATSSLVTPLTAGRHHGGLSCGFRVDVGRRPHCIRCILQPAQREQCSSFADGR